MVRSPELADAGTPKPAEPTDAPPTEMPAAEARRQRVAALLEEIKGNAATLATGAKALLRWQP